MPAKASRAAFGEALLELGAKDERIVTLDADLSKSTMTIGFAKKYPQRAFNLARTEFSTLHRAERHSWYRLPPASPQSGSAMRSSGAVSAPGI